VVRALLQVSRNPFPSGAVIKVWLAKSRRVRDSPRACAFHCARRAVAPASCSPRGGRRCLGCSAGRPGRRREHRSPRASPPSRCCTRHVRRDRRHPGVSGDPARGHDRQRHQPGHDPHPGCRRPYAAGPCRPQLVSAFRSFAPFWALAYSQAMACSTRRRQLTERNKPSHRGSVRDGSGRPGRSTIRP